MHTFFLAAALAILFSAFLCLYRVLVGPVIIDRIIGVNVIGTKTIAIILLTGYIYGRVDFFVDIAFVYALINFIGALARWSDGGAVSQVPLAGGRSNTYQAPVCQRLDLSRRPDCEPVRLPKARWNWL